MQVPYHYQSIIQISEQLRTRDLSPVELTEWMLERIAVSDPTLKAYATLMPEQAIKQARAAERDIVNGQYLGPLHGVPIAIKDLCCTRGTATMAGCAVLADHVPDYDATVVTRLANAGAILLGKLNLTEGAMAGYNPRFDVPENPWKAGHWSGASSSGSGAATAAGLAFATLGSDTGGSIRHPAAVCGTVGLKPTWGLVSRHGVLDLAQSLDHVGPLTRTSADAGIVLQAIAGRDIADPTTLATPAANMLERLDDGIKGIRIGWDEQFARDDMDREFASAVAGSVEVLASLGAIIIPTKVPDRLRDYLAGWATLCSAEALTAHADFYPERADEYGPWFREWLAYGAKRSAADYARAHDLRIRCNGEMASMMRDLDLFACPSTPREAYPVNDEISYGPIPPNRDPWYSRFTVPMDYAGLPTLSLPCGLSSAGLPLSVQLVGHHLGEPGLVRAGHAFEQATSWHLQHPPEWWM